MLGKYIVIFVNFIIEIKKELSMEKEKYILEFEGEDKIPVNTFSNYLYHFRAIYSISYDVLPETKRPEENFEQISDYIDKVKEYIKEQNGYIGRKYFFKKLDEDLIIYEMEKKSPLTITVGGCLVALVVAVIISGGEVNLSKGKFKLNPLGEGLKKLKEFKNM